MLRNLIRHALGLARFAAPDYFTAVVVGKLPLMMSEIALSPKL
jgi:hypothetical protein